MSYSDAAKTITGVPCTSRLMDHASLDELLEAKDSAELTRELERLAEVRQRLRDALDNRYSKLSWKTGKEAVRILEVAPDFPFGAGTQPMRRFQFGGLGEYYLWIDLASVMQSAECSVDRTASTLFELDDLTCRFGEHFAFRRLSFSLTQGRVVAVCGHSGSGKSTLLNALGLLRYGSHLTGTVRLQLSCEGQNSEDEQHPPYDYQTISPPMGDSDCGVNNLALSFSRPICCRL